MNNKMPKKIDYVKRQYFFINHFKKWMSIKDIQREYFNHKKELRLIDKW